MGELELQRRPALQQEVGDAASPTSTGVLNSADTARSRVQRTAGASSTAHPPVKVKPAGRCDKSAFWQKTQRRLHMLKNTVPLPDQPWWGAEQSGDDGDGAGAARGGEN